MDAGTKPGQTDVKDPIFKPIERGEDVPGLKTFQPEIPLQRQVEESDKDALVQTYIWRKANTGATFTLLVKFFVAPFPCEVLKVKFFYTNAAGSQADLQIRRNSLGTDSDMLTQVHPLDSGAGTVHTYKRNQTKGLTPSNCVLLEDDTIDTYIVTGNDSPSNMTELVIVIVFRPLARGQYRLPK